MWKRISRRWSQFGDEAKGLVAGFQLLVVNLVYIQRIFPEKTSLVVIVDSWREAFILWLLWVVGVLPRYKVLVIHRTSQLNPYAAADFGGESLLVATSRAFTKHYQLLADLRHQRRLVVL